MKQLHNTYYRQSSFIIFFFLFSFDLQAIQVRYLRHDLYTKSTPKSTRKDHTRTQQTIRLQCLRQSFRSENGSWQSFENSRWHIAAQMWILWQKVSAASKFKKPHWHTYWRKAIQMWHVPANVYVFGQCNVTRSYAQNRRLFQV